MGRDDDEDDPDDCGRHAYPRGVEHLDLAHVGSAGAASFDLFDDQTGDDQVDRRADQRGGPTEDRGVAERYEELRGDEPLRSAQVPDDRDHHGDEGSVVEERATDRYGRQDLHLHLELALRAAYKPGSDQAHGARGIHSGCHHIESSDRQDAGVREAGQTRVRWREAEGDGDGKRAQENGCRRELRAEKKHQGHEEEREREPGVDGHRPILTSW